jgi:hypothetical protein
MHCAPRLNLLLFHFPVRVLPPFGRKDLQDPEGTRGEAGDQEAEGRRGRAASAAQHARTNARSVHVARRAE